MVATAGLLTTVASLDGGLSDWLRGDRAAVDTYLAATPSLDGVTLRILANSVVETASEESSHSDSAMPDTSDAGGVIWKGLHDPRSTHGSVPQPHPMLAGLPYMPKQLVNGSEAAEDDLGTLL